MPRRTPHPPCPSEGKDLAPELNPASPNDDPGRGPSGVPSDATCHRNEQPPARTVRLASSVALSASKLSGHPRRAQPRLGAVLVPAGTGWGTPLPAGEGGDLKPHEIQP